LTWLQIRRDEFFPLRILGSLTAAALAVVDAIANEVNGSFFLLAGIAALVLTFPWQLLRTLKAGPFELSLEQGQVHGAVRSLAISADEPDEKAEERFSDLLARLQPDIERARGSRVLWIDDKPHRVVGERRLFQAVGIETLVAIPVRTRCAHSSVTTISTFSLPASHVRARKLTAIRSGLASALFSGFGATRTM